MSNPDTPIMAAQVTRQLRRMLGSVLFQVNKQPALFFELLVNSALKGQNPTAKHICTALSYKNPDLVKTRKNEVRNLLKEYYATLGRLDPIFIKLPNQPRGAKKKSLHFAPTGAYRPVFEPNPRVAVVHLLQMAKHFLRKANPDALKEANDYFQRLRAHDPGNSEGFFGQVEVACLETLYCVDRTSPADCIQEARFVFKHVGVTNPNSLLAGTHGERWNDYAVPNVDDKGVPIPNTARWYAVGGALNLCQGKFEAAAQSFKEALKLDADAITYWWLLLFLFLIGQRSPCLFVLKNLSEEEPDSARALAAYVAGMYATRQFDKAKDAISHALKLDPNDWIVRLVACLVCMARSEGDEAAAHGFTIRFLLETGSFEFMPGLCLLAARGANSISEEFFGEMRAIASKVLFETNKRRDWIQIALFHLACNDADAGADALLQAGEEPTLPLYFVPFLPVFDAVRDHPKLKEMMQALAKKTDIDFSLEYLATGRVALPEKSE